MKETKTLKDFKKDFKKSAAPLFKSNIALAEENIKLISRIIKAKKENVEMEHTLTFLYEEYYDCIKAKEKILNDYEIFLNRE